MENIELLDRLRYLYEQLSDITLEIEQIIDNLAQQEEEDYEH